MWKTSLYFNQARGILYLVHNIFKKTSREEGLKWKKQDIFWSDWLWDYFFCFSPGSLMPVHGTIAAVPGPVMISAEVTGNGATTGGGGIGAMTAGLTGIFRGTSGMTDGTGVMETIGGATATTVVSTIGGGISGKTAATIITAGGMAKIAAGDTTIGATTTEEGVTAAALPIARADVSAQASTTTETAAAEVMTTLTVARDFLSTIAEAQTAAADEASNE